MFTKVTVTFLLFSWALTLSSPAKKIREIDNSFFKIVMFNKTALLRFDVTNLKVINTAGVAKHHLRRLKLYFEAYCLFILLEFFTQNTNGCQMPKKNDRNNKSR